VSGSKTVRGSSARIKVKVPGKGTILVTGAGLRPALMTASSAGTRAVRVSLSERARRSLARKHRVKIRLTVRFVPARGQARSVGVSVTFISPSKRSSSSGRRAGALSSEARKGR
jgi:hypothetical protein